MIFNFSSQNAEESGNLSGGITRKILSKIVFIQSKSAKEKQQILETAETIIRKLAHLSIYTLMGLILMSLFYTYNVCEKYRIIYSLIFGILYATSDEIHQYFVPGRSMQITDIMIDTIGVTLGICFIIMINKMKKNKR